MKNGGLIGLVVALLLAAVATLSVFMYVRGVQQDAQADGERVEVVVSKQDIRAGTDFDDLIAGGAFTTVSIPEDALVQGAVTDLAELEGQEAGAAILAGEQISTARIKGSGTVPGGALGIPPGYQAVTVPFETSAGTVGGDVRRGDHVAVYATFDEQGGGVNATAVLAPDVEVLKVAAPEAGGVASGGTAQTMVTLALRHRDAQRVVFANEQGSVWLGLLAPGEKGVAQRPITVAQVLR